MNEVELEYAEANKVKVFETNVLHASDVIYWLDGSSAVVTEQMSRIDVPLDIQLSQRPRDLKLISSPGKTALLRKPTNEIIPGIASQAERTRPAPVLFNLVGEVWDRSRRYNPVALNLNPGTGDGIAIVMYPSPLGSQKSAGGCVYGHIVNEDSSQPLVWALVEIAIKVSLSETLTIRAQCDGKGDFILSLKRLPPLPESITEYLALLTITAGLANTPELAPDVSSYVALEVESSSGVGDFNLSYAMTVRPGERTRVNSMNKDYLAVQSV